MYHQCDRPYDYEAEGDFPPIDGDALRGIATALLFALMVIGAPIAFFMDAVALGVTILVVGVVGFALVWITSVRR